MKSPTEYTNRELGILLEKLTEKIDGFHADIDKRMVKIESDVEENKTFRTKSMAIVSVVAMAGSAIATKVLANLGI
jgi:hypothetical protein